ncbi:serine hydrolase domain-containing protein [Pseudonocardia sp.]|uniref:serine hydrolase domain-containing protein n=1 Tax=Pseudonocardia sp. TaxID=60912 RepID=UPI003D12C6F9
MHQIRELLDGKVAAGLLPGYAAALRLRGATHVLVGGRTAVDPGARPVTEEMLFRIASLTKPMGAALALTLEADGVLALDDPVGRWLPELAEPRVLVAPDAPLDATVAAERAVTVRDLLTGVSGWGIAMADVPVQRAMSERGVHPSPLPPALSPDEFVGRIGELPLAFQPGAGWRYDTGMDVLGVLLARAAGKPLADVLAERVTGPLGMDDTGFWTAEAGRLATAYEPGPDGLELLDPPHGAFASPPQFPKLAGGLVSTVGDVLRFHTAMADGGGPVLAPAQVALLTSDALTPEQRRDAGGFLGPGTSWGLGTGVDIAAVEPWQAPGRWGWTGGTGTDAKVDPMRDAVSVLLTQRAMVGPEDGPEPFWAAVAAAGA